MHFETTQHFRVECSGRNAGGVSTLFIALQTSRQLLKLQESERNAKRCEMSTQQMYAAHISTCLLHNAEVFPP